MTFRLRAYQKEVVAECVKIFGRGTSELCVMPTASGKTAVIADVVRTLAERGLRILVVSHVAEIIEQDTAAFKKHAPDIDYSILCAELNPNTRIAREKVIFASIHTIYKLDHLKPFHVILIDEVQAVGRSERSMYRQFIDSQRSKKTTLPLIGFSATPYRLDSGYLHEGDDALFDRIAIEIPVAPLVQKGWLAPLVTPDETAPKPKISTSGFRRDKNSDEYVMSSADDQHEKLDIETVDCVRDACRRAKDRKKIFAYCCTIRHATLALIEFRRQGRKAELLTHLVGRAQRRERLRKIRDGEIDTLVSVRMLTTGIDVPDVDCIVMLRPTVSTGLYVQIVGRGLRPAPNKTNTLVLDYVGNIDRHGAIDDIMPNIVNMGPGQGLSKHLFKECPSCGHEMRNFAQLCVMCDHHFIQVSETASSVSIMQTKTKETRPKKSSRAAQRQQRREERATVLPPIPPSADPLLSTTEVAEILGYGPTYVKQMRSYGVGPTFYEVPGGYAMTGHGARSIVYRTEDIEEWTTQHPEKSGMYGKGQVRKRKQGFFKKGYNPKGVRKKEIAGDVE